MVMDPDVEAAFRLTCRLVLGRELKGLEGYRSWLCAGVRQSKSTRSAGESGAMLHYSPLSSFEKSASRMLPLDEALSLGRSSLGTEEVARLDVAHAASMLSKISLYHPGAALGENFAVEKCSLYYASQHCYDGEYYSLAKYCAYCFWPRESESVFGCDMAFSSKSCLRCFHSVGLTRCLEVGQSADCSDCLFCHNVEGCTECMFCFNVKAKRYAIGNIEYPKDEYLRVKKLVLAEIASKLEKDKKLDLSIFNVGAKR